MRDDLQRPTRQLIVGADMPGALHLRLVSGKVLVVHVRKVAFREAAASRPSNRWQGLEADAPITQHSKHVQDHAAAVASSQAAFGG